MEILMFLLSGAIFGIVLHVGAEFIKGKRKGNKNGD